MAMTIFIGLSPLGPALSKCRLGVSYGHALQTTRLQARPEVAEFKHRASRGAPT